MEKQIIYLFRAFPCETGNYEIKGDKYRIDVEIDPNFREDYRNKNVTRKFTKAFSHTIREAIRTGKPERRMQVMQTIDDI